MPTFNLNKRFYNSEELLELLKEASEKNFSDSELTLETRFIVWQNLPDAVRGTVLWPVQKNGKLVGKEEIGYCHLGYESKYVGRAHFLHHEIVRSEKEWFVRIN